MRIRRINDAAVESNITAPVPYAPAAGCAKLVTLKSNFKVVVPHCKKVPGEVGISNLDQVL